MPPYVPKWQMECIDFFYKVSTQWIVAPNGGRVGLNYVAVVEMAKIYGFELHPFSMDVIRKIERFYLDKKE